MFNVEQHVVRERQREMVIEKEEIYKQDLCASFGGESLGVTEVRLM